MAFRYANRADVLAQLDIAEADTTSIAELERIEATLTDAFDYKVGRSFGEATFPTTRTIAIGRATETAVLVRPARVVTGIAHGGAYDGIGWAGETVEATWHDVYTRDGLVYGVTRADGYSWPSRIRVTATWASDSDAAVPGDVADCLTWLTIRAYRLRTSSPAELVGPDGMTVSTPDGWRDETVKAILAKYRVVEVIV